MADHSQLVAAVRDSAKRLGIDPSDLLTAVSYETAGTLDPWKKGPRTQWGEHRGLLQWGEPQQKKYGVTPDMSVADQMRAAEKYLTDAGVKPGHGLLDVYSAINAGRVGLYNRSDANNGGAPGTVADKVATQMVGHRARANSLLGMPGGPSEAPVRTAAPVVNPAAVSAPVAQAASAPMSLAPGGAAAAPAGDNGMAAALAALAAIPAAAQEPIQPAPMPEIQYFKPNARKLAAAMARNPLG